MGMDSGRFFGFVIGGTVPAALGADWLVSAWDQNSALFAPTPGTAVVEEIAGRWVIEMLGLPPASSFAFVTGGQLANTTALAAARHHVLAAVGWDVEADGLVGAPPIRLIVGREVHVTVPRSARLLGLGTQSIEYVAVDENGAMIPESLEEVLAAGRPGPAIVCCQAGNVNTGAPRSGGRARRRGSSAWCVAARRWRDRTVGGCVLAVHAARTGSGGLVVDGRAQVAQRRLRLRHHGVCPPWFTPSGDDGDGVVSRAGPAWHRPRSGRLEPRVLTTGSCSSRVCGARVPRP